MNSSPNTVTEIVAVICSLPEDDLIWVLKFAEFCQESRQGKREKRSRDSLRRIRIQLAFPKM